MSNYKIEVENTEKLNSDINSAFTDINTELKKDDDLIAEDLFDVDRCIGELKGSRKKWASGGYAGLMNKGSGNFILDLNNLDFEPSFILANNYMPKGGERDEESTISINMIDDFYRFGNTHIWRLNNQWFYQNDNFMERYPQKISVTDSKMENVNLLKEKKQVSILVWNNTAVKNIKWYAFE